MQTHLNQILFDNKKLFISPSIFFIIINATSLIFIFKSMINDLCLKKNFHF